MNVSRIMQLIAHLSNIQDKNFDMDNWMRFKNNMSARYPNVLMQRPEVYADDIKDFIINPVSHCGTAGCIAGHVLLLGIAEQQEVNAASSVSGFAQEWLQVNNLTAHHLFTPGGYVSYRKVGRKDAIRVLEILRDTGYVDWEKAAPDAIHPLTLDRMSPQLTAYFAGPREIAA